MAVWKSQTVGAAVRSILPLGSNPEWMIKAANPNLNKRDRLYRWRMAPQMPTDLFAVSAYLCQIGGVVGFFEPSPYGRPPESGHFSFDRDYRDWLDDVAWKWRGGERGGRQNLEGGKLLKKKRKPSEFPPKEVEELWTQIIDDWSNPTNCGYYRHVSAEDPGVPYPPRWWKAALALTMISDMVVVRPFSNPMKRFEGTPFGRLLSLLYYENDSVLEKRDLTAQPDGDKPAKTQSAPRPPASLTYMVDSNVACVLPKVRVASVGATVRNISRDLALLPGRGEMRCYWDMTDTEPESEDHETLDILLIPAPFSISPTDFVPEKDANSGKTRLELRNDKPDWENFKVSQTWIDSPDRQEEFLRACVDLLIRAKSETRSVNGVILPEYAVTYELFDRLCEHLKKKSDEIGFALEFVIAGASDNCDDERANTLLTRVWSKREPDKHITNSRRKHHRWRIDRRQVEAYGLGTALNPKINNWWETTPIGQREFYFHRFRKGSVFAALICEELARSDVCHDILRAVGPNLVFAILMDSAQMAGRWSAQYAASLADDPGCAVLSFTSFGLVDRANRNRPNGSRSVALWKDDSGNLVEMAMPKGTGPRGILLSLWSEHVNDQTITGKRSLVRAWRYSSHSDICLG